MNLIGNALKYSSDGTPVVVTLGVDRREALLTVEDSGIGIPNGTEAAIFQPFGRAENARVRNVPGMGLGLYISRQIVQSHGGRIWAESAGEDRGTLMHVSLPLESEVPAVD